MPVEMNLKHTIMYAVAVTMIGTMGSVAIIMIGMIITICGQIIQPLITKTSRRATLEKMFGTMTQLTLTHCVKFRTVHGKLRTLSMNDFISANTG